MVYRRVVRISKMGWGMLLLAAGCLPSAAQPAVPIDRLIPSQPPQPVVATNAQRPSVRLELDSANAVWSGQFAEGTNSQEVDLSKPVRGRYFCLESLSAQDGRPYAAAAELSLLDAAGEALDRKPWRIVYADSEEHEREDGSAENAIDGNPATYWHTQWSTASPNHPHHLVIDLGQSRTIAGFRYLPRQGAGLPGGRIRDYRIYVGDHLVEDFLPDKTPPANAYLLGYFTGAGDGGLHLAFSLNGYRWMTMNFGHAFLKPEVGAKLMRDPCLLQGPDGTFRMVWTAAWSGNYIGYASSRDLVHWSPQELIPVMTNEPAACNCWAPELFWEAGRQQYLIYWASTVTNKFGGATRSDNNRIYCTTTRDFQSFTPTRLLYDPGFGALDATLLRVTNKYYLFFKDDTANHLQMAVAADPEGPFSSATLINGSDALEGPAAFLLGDQAVVCYHLMGENQNGAVKSADMIHWEDISAGMSLPPGSEQGKILPVTGDDLRPLVQSGRLEFGATPEALELGIGDWIWATHLAERQSCRFWRSFAIPANDRVVRATLLMTADNSYTAWLDGQEIGRGGDANSLAEYDLTWLLTPGRHVLAVEAFNDTMDAGLIAGLRVKLESGRKIEIFSNPSWRLAAGDDPGWKTESAAAEGWAHAKVVGYGGRAWWQHPAKITQVPPLLPPVVHFWQQGWVLAILLLACLTVLMLWIRQGVRLALQTRANLLLERERARIARDMHDELGSGLTQLTLLGELVLREAPQADEPRKRLMELCARARGLLRSMDEIVWTVNPRRDTVKDFAAFISEHAQEFLSSTCIRCRQEVAEELPAIPLDLPQRRNLLLAVKEAIRNAARHSGADEITLKVAVAGNLLKVAVEDNGRGFSPTNTQCNRNGLVNMKQRLADIGGTFTLNAAPGKGCCITFVLPLQTREQLIR
jgi:signal transduction histidine kinase